jgi:hypothetical protein
VRRTSSCSGMVRNGHGEPVDSFVSSLVMHARNLLFTAVRIVRNATEAHECCVSFLVPILRRKIIRTSDYRVCTQGDAEHSNVHLLASNSCSRTNEGIRQVKTAAFVTKYDRIGKET